MNAHDEPAFPVEDSYHTGLTRLEWFAGQALAGIASITGIDWSDGGKRSYPEGAAKACFDIAEAMCAESAKRKAAQ